MTLIKKVLLLCICVNNIRCVSINDLKNVFRDNNCIEEREILVEHGITNLHTFVSQVIEQTTPSQSETRIFDEKEVLTKLHELVQYNKIKYYFELLDEQGPAHKKLFTMRLTLGEENYEAEETSLKRARKALAGIALSNTKYVFPPMKVKNHRDYDSHVMKLNNLGMKLGLKINYEFLDKKELKKALAVAKSSNLVHENRQTQSYLTKLNNTINRSIQSKIFKIKKEIEGDNPPFVVILTVDDEEYLGVGWSKQIAKHNAALKALEDIENNSLEKQSVCNTDGLQEICKTKKASIKSPISEVYEYGERKKVEVNFEIIEETGPAHKKTFVTRCTVGNLVSEGEGKSKKESKKKSSEKMLEMLQTEMDFINPTHYTIKKAKPKKNKNKKIVKGITDKLVMHATNALNAASDYIPDFITGNQKDEQIVKKQSKYDSDSGLSGKDVFLHVMQSLGMQSQFNDLGESDGKTYSLLSLNVRPSYVCLGYGQSLSIAENKASFGGLKLLLELDLIKDFDLKESIQESLKTDEMYYMVEEDSDIESSFKS